MQLKNISLKQKIFKGAFFASDLAITSVLAMQIPWQKSFEQIAFLEKILVIGFLTAGLISVYQGYQFIKNKE